VLALAVIGSVVAGNLRLAAIMVLIAVAASMGAILFRTAAYAVGVPGSLIEAVRRPSVVAVSFGLSLVAWLLVAFHVALAAWSAGITVTPMAGVRVFTSATLFGGLTLMPAGIGSTGTLAILQLQGLSLSLSDALVVVTLLRLTTVGATFTVGAICLVAVLRARKTAQITAAVHFDEISEDYGRQFSEHVWSHLLTRKVRMIAHALPNPPLAAGRGLDLGCGLGSQCLELSKRGYTVFGLDPAHGLVRKARKSGANVVAGSALVLPFRDQSLDFVYAVGVLHHLPDRRSQRDACLEIARVLKPEGFLLVHETNPRNPLFRFYMGYVFPILKKIDEGTEWWIPAEIWSAVPGLKLSNVQYFTFMPDFVPAWMMRPFLAVDRWLEASFLRPYSVHYMATLRRDLSWSASFVSEAFADPREPGSISAAGDWSASNAGR
jgi:ubiquinone/menaquinone biosynthesis C-methylase UbiE